MATHGGECLRRMDAPLHVTLPTGEARVIVVGDPHGCCAELRALLEKCEYSQERGDVVVLIGDLVNKGPSSAEVVRLAVDSGFHAVCGNHDLIALERWEEWSRTGVLPPPEEHGDWEYLKALREQDLDYLRGLSLTITLPDQADTVLVHAGFVPGTPMHRQALLDMVMIRNVVAGDGRYFANHGVDEGEPWAKVWDGCTDGSGAGAGGDEGPEPARRFVLFGHDAPRGLQQYEHAWGLDTNCCNGGQLTACVLPVRELVQVPALGRLHKAADGGAARQWRPL